jgi:hypothetical protein
MLDGWLDERIGRRGFVYSIAALGVGASGCVDDSGGDGEDGTRGDEESGEDGGSGEDGESRDDGDRGENETEAEKSDESENEETTDEDDEDTDFAIYFTAEDYQDDRLVATEEGVEPGSVSKEVARDGSHRVSFALTEDAVRGLEDTVEGVDEREDAGIRIEYDGEVVFDGPFNPSLWEHLRNGDFSDADGRMSVTGLKEGEADELAQLLQR